MSWGETPPGDVVLGRFDSPDHPMAPWFAHHREQRRLHTEQFAARAGSGARRSRAIITMVYNEPVFLPLWLRYYSQFFAPEDIYVFDNDTDDGSTSRDGFVRIPAARGGVDALWTRDTIQALQHELAARYDVVLVTDVDEFVAPVPTLGTLGDYLDTFDEEWVNCLGYELLHMKDSEPPLDVSRPILSQRRHWFPNGAYDKAAVTTRPLEWRQGFHGRADFQYNLDPDLRLVHLHRMDYETCLARHRSRQNRRWAEVDTEQRWALHNQITEDAEFERWFYEDSCFEGLEIKVEEMDPAWRNVF
jgi:hypothetical protein